ncbi:galactose-1-phosphate uridylyltransferase [Corynebacterium heidelbergense]|uniref:Galactose-1-phosphate uridylyltransferase n=1 Tax=Corynebacterium heidelbergense TaxID=2055947 RepID=A0A364V480_9CORY|nr:galactose-1-phosphate uridylyltransferase [Corynebacterium heidelbergense]RAV31442.1 galactose-1-phosphate uridylyltransferase [Corynebacterium heidelbergense]
MTMADHGDGDQGTGHSFRVTRTNLADGRELLYFDDDPAFVSGERSRELTDRRDLPPAATQSEMRQDPLTGQWYVYAAHRMNRTFMPPANENPLAPTRPGELPTEIPADEYDVVVFENRFPSLSMHTESAASAQVDGDPLFPRAAAVGRCEVVCFTSDATLSFRDLPLRRARTVVEAWAHRTRELGELPGVKYVYPFENRGAEIGVTLQHPHGQIYAYPFVPPRAAEIAERSAAYWREHGRDLFTDVLAAEVRAGTRIIAQGEHFTAYVPAAAKWPVEAMLMPNRPVANFAELAEAEKHELTVMYLDLLRRVDRFFEGVDRTPYIASWNQAPVGGAAQGCGGMRLYLQLYSMMRSPGRMKFLAGSESGQEAWISDTTPEAIAQRLRDIA